MIFINASGFQFEKFQRFIFWKTPSSLLDWRWFCIPNSMMMVTQMINVENCEESREFPTGKKMYDFPITNLCVISFFVLGNSFGGKREMLMRKSWLFPLLFISIALLWQVCSLWLKIVEKWWKWKPRTDYNRTILTRPWIFGRM